MHKTRFEKVDLPCIIISDARAHYTQYMYPPTSILQKFIMIYKRVSIPAQRANTSYTFSTCDKYSYLYRSVWLMLITKSPISTKNVKLLHKNITLILLLAFKHIALSFSHGNLRYIYYNYYLLLSCRFCMIHTDITSLAWPPMQPYHRS